jgi:hypothetical protein
MAVQDVMVIASGMKPVIQHICTLQKKEGSDLA